MAEYIWLADDAFAVKQFFTEEECARYVAAAEAAGFESATITGGLGAVVDRHVRDNDRVILDNASWATEIWQRLKDFAPGKMGGHNAIGCNERFRIYRYRPGQQFKWHHDGAFERENGERSRVTVLIYLNDGYLGGDTEFQDFSLKPERGMALGFAHFMVHRGQVVLQGTKYVLRTDVMYDG